MAVTNLVSPKPRRPSAARTPGAPPPDLPPGPVVLMPSPDPARAVVGFSYQPADLAEGRLPTGVQRLDVLLGGGWPSGCATLLFGPPFCGKQQLQQHAIVKAATLGVATTVLVHTVGARAMSAKLRALDAAFPAAEEAGLVRYIDMHSLGETVGYPNTTYIRDPANPAEVLGALGTGRGGSHGVPGLLALESVSTLLVDLGRERAFHFLRTLLSRALAQGGVALLCLEGGMHAESEVQMAKHLCAGMIEMRKKGEAHCLHVEGLETAFARPGWIEYEFTSRTFKVTGSFASRTIR